MINPLGESVKGKLRSPIEDSSGVFWQPYILKLTNNIIVCYRFYLQLTSFFFSNIRSKSETKL